MKPLSVIYLFSIIFFFFSCENTTRENINGEEVKTSDWMYELFKKKSSIKLTEIAIPGTHDALTDLIKADNPYSSQPIAEWSDSVKKVVGKKGIFLFSQNQSQPVIEQLEGGIRYLDFRLQTYNNTIWSFHHLISNPIQPVVDQIATFTRKHPKEIIIIDLQKLNIEPPLYDELLQIFLDRLSPHIARTDELSVNSSLSDFWEKKMNVILLSSYPPQNERQTKLIFSRDDNLVDYWPNKYDSKQVFKILEDSVKVRPMEKLFVSQTIQSPNDSVLLESLKTGPNGIIEMVNQKNSVNNLFSDWFPDFTKAASQSNKKVNIMIFDQYQSNPLIIKDILQYNADIQM